jgi:membrane protease YdiL (CAAX protease family)
LFAVDSQLGEVATPRGKNWKEATMSDQPTNDTQLGLRWIYLAWVGIAFTSVVIGMISGIVQGPPEPVVAKWGISNFSIFAIALYSLGSAISVVLLYVLLKRRGLSFTRIGLVGKFTPKAAAFSIAGLVFASAHIFVGPGTILIIFLWSFIPAYLFLKCGNLYPAFCFHILNNCVAYVVFPLWIL